ncbi:MAG: type I restriction enzyme HsdR N-terminal domain-containing protein [Methylophilus sp.]
MASTTDKGLVDYVLFIERLPIAVIEAKRDECGETILWQRNKQKAIQHQIDLFLRAFEPANL